MPTVEERLAALEARMAAWIDQQPTNYYPHQYSGEEIDESVGVTQDTVPTLVRPNLLDNWYFGRPVNQRGQTEYKGWHSIDRWFLLNNNELVITDNAIELTYIDNNYVIWQKMESIPKGTYSLSLLFADGVFVTWSGVVDISQAGFDVGTARHKNWNIAIHSDKTIRITCIGSSGDKIAILAAKLELGPTQTLAHKEGDRWVLNEVPDYGEQLRRCLRHDYILGNASQNCPIGIGTAYSNDGVVCVIQLPEYMRTNPAVVLSGGVQIRFSATQILTATSVLNYGFYGDKVQLYFPGLSGLTPGQSCDLFTQANSRLEFNSNL